MASIERRGDHYIRVVWRQDGKKQYERFGDLRAAEVFKGRVEQRGNRWPPGWTPGVGDEPPDGASRCPTFREWADACIESRARANARTRADYKRDLENHVYPTFGATPLDRIDAQAVGAWLIRLTEQRHPVTGEPLRSAKTVKNVHALASSIYQDAMQAGHTVGPNPFRGAMRALPVVRVEEMVFLSKQEVDVIAGAISALYRALVILLAHTGLRWSEASALRVADVELFGQRKTVTVTKAWKRDADGTFYLSEPKSRRSRRTIALDAETVDALIPLVAAREPGDWLFTNARGNYVHQSTFAREHWTPTVKRLNAEGVFSKRPRIHDLRHTHASWLIAAGVPLTAVQRRLGHESIQTTSDRYGHLSSEMDDQVVAALDGIAASKPIHDPADID